MNFSIIMPGGCNAKCDFCFWEQKPTRTNYISRLRDIFNELATIDEELTLSITGGEPTVSPIANSIIQLIAEHKHLFSKVVLTTNGTNRFSEFLPVVDHVNVSRHFAVQKSNNEVFKTATLGTNQLKDEIDRCNYAGIDVTISCVIQNESFTMSDARDIIGFAKTVGATYVTFRAEYKKYGLGMPIAEQSFFSSKLISASSCDVCRSRTQLIKGMYVTWKGGLMETGTVDEPVYEAIFHPSGRLTLDWAGEREIEIQDGKFVEIPSLIIGGKYAEVSNLMARVAKLEAELKGYKELNAVKDIKITSPAVISSGCDIRVEPPKCGAYKLNSCASQSRC